MPADRLSLNDAASDLGVHYQTAYRWVRSGRLPAVLVDGKYEVERVALDAVERDRRSPTAPTAPGRVRLARQSDAIAEALVAGDEAAARKIANRLADDGTPVVELIESVLVPPLRQIGEDWHAGKISIWVEHRASAIVERILADLSPNPRGRRRGTALVAAVSGDRHSLPTVMATVVLRDHNWKVHHLGADMPPDSLIDFARSQPIDAAVLSSTNPATRDVAHETAEQLAGIDVPTLVGEPGSSLAGLPERLAELTSASAT